MSTPITAYAVKNGSTLALKLDRAAADEYATRHGGEVIPLVDKAEHDKARRLSGDVSDILARQCIAMQAAVIDAEVGRGKEAALAWISNTLIGPGLFPDLDAAVALRDADNNPAQAWFDLKLAEHEEFRAKHADPLAPPAIFPAPLILAGVGKFNGDGFKDVTKAGEIVFAWNAELPKPWAPGQFQRVGNDAGWTASTAQYHFRPATMEEVKALIGGTPLFDRGGE